MTHTLRFLPALLFCLVLGIGSAATTTSSTKPNIVFILADDLGCGELGCYGQTKIRTPNLDRLASQGMRFTQHYSGSPVCAPSRCVLMTGKHPGHAYVRNNRETKPEGQFPIPADTPTIARTLKENGYVTGAFGKWGLGGPGSTGEPWRQGFDRFYGYLCQAKAHNFYPQKLWDNDREVTLDNPPIPSRDNLPADADPNSSASYARYTGKEYSADLIAEKAREFVRESRNQPFFLYFPTTVPHLSLQVPEDSLNEYIGKWPEKPYVGGSGYVPNFTPRATYAAMITRLDAEVGRLLALLDELKLAENTIVVFTSDNGPTHPPTGGADVEYFKSAGDLRGFKGSVYEGGLRVPLLVRWPGKVQAGSVCNKVTGFEDWFPTLAELAGAAAAGEKPDGVSIAATLQGKQQPDRGFLYREFPAYGGQQAIRVGDWKLVRADLTPQKNKQTSPTLELFNIAEDPAESRNRADEHPEVVARLMEVARREHTASEEFPFRALDAERGTNPANKAGETGAPPAGE